MSDAALTDSTADTGATTTAILGVGMTHRARSQSVLARHWSPIGVVGAVGRASVGFGLAVGRSRSIRPTVRFDDLNSAALRPSFDLVRRHRSLHADEFLDDVTGPGGTEQTSATRAGRPAEQPAVPATRIRVPRPQVERAQRHPKRPVRPTWTDQIIQRSSIGFVAPAPGSPVPVVTPPADFVSSGDARLDQLRLLVRERDGSGSDPASAASPAVRRIAETRTRDASVLRRTTADEPTIAAPNPGPGRLARAMRPESAVAPAVPRSRLGDPPAPLVPGADPTRAGASSVVPRRPASPSTSAPRRRASRPQQPSRLDQLRSILTQQGILPSDEASGTDHPSSDIASTDGATTDNARRAPGDADESHIRRSTRTTSDLQRSTTSPLGPTDGPSAVRPPTPVSPAPTGTVTTAPTDRPDGGGSANAEASRLGALALVERSPATAPSPTTTSDTGQHAITSPSTERATSTTSDVAPVRPRTITSPPAQQLRAQRLMRTGLVADAPSADPVSPDTAATSAVELGDPHPTTRSTLEAVRTSASIDTVAAALLPTVETDRTRFDSVTPSLARVDSSPSTVVRRVTLPRALSTAHRPAVRLAATDGRAVPAAASGPALQSVSRTSTVSLADVGDARAPAATTDGGTSGAPRVDSSSTGRTARPLLQVVRHIAADGRHGAEDPPGLASATSLDDAGARRLDGDRAAPPTVGRTPRRSVPAEGSGDTIPSVAARADDSGRAPAERVADQFMSVLSETMRNRPTPLPTTYRPLAEAIAGPRPVMLSTDTASRKALRSVGKVAATTGDTIHLDRQAVSSSRLDEVMAHELTHVAHPSPTPRFFDDIDDSPEERRAEQVARLMARSPLAPSATTTAPSVRRSPDDRTIRRTPATSSPPSSSSGTMSANALAASLTASPAPSNTVQRWDTTKPSGQRAGIGSHRTGSSGAPSPAQPTVAPKTETTETPPGGPNPSDEWFRKQLEANLDRVVRLLEDRMIVELERRGGRAWRQS